MMMHTLSCPQHPTSRAAGTAPPAVRRPPPGNTNRRSSRSPARFFLHRPPTALPDLLSTGPEFAATAASAAASLSDDDLDLFGPASSLRLGFLAAAGLWAAALRLISIPQLAFLFLGKIDGDRPVDGVERFLSLAAGADGPASPTALAAVRAGATAVFVVGGCGVAGLLGAGLGDDIWGVATGLGALAAGGLMEAGRPPVLSEEEAAAEASRADAFTAWAEGGALARSGACHESEVVKAARALGGPAAAPPRWTDEEVKSALRAWAAVAGSDSPPRRSPPSRSAAGYWKGVSVAGRGVGRK
jgi:hypothetical protein